MIFVPKHIARPDRPPPEESPVDREPSAEPAVGPPLEPPERPFPTVLQALGLMLLVLIFQALFAIPFEIVELEEGTPLSRHPGSLAVVNFVAFGAVLAWATRRAGAGLREVYPLKGVGVGRLLVVATLIVGTSILLSDVDNLVRSVFPPPEAIVDLFENVLSTERTPIGAFFALVVVAPVTEELLFRGIILRGFLANYGQRTAIVLSALLFAVIHVNPWQLLPAFAAGLILAWLAVETGSLVPCIFAHAVNNSAGFLAELIPVEIPGFTGGLSGPVEFQPVWLDALGLVLLAVSFTVLRRLFKEDALEREPAYAD